MTTNPIQPAPQVSEQKRKFWGKMIWISAISLVLSICLGIGTFLAGMMHAFNSLSKSGTADPAELAGDISNAMFAAMLTIPIAFAALVLFIIAIIRHRKFSNPIHSAI